MVAQTYVKPGGGGGGASALVMEKVNSLASFPISLVESLAPADRGHAHFTTWL